MGWLNSIEPINQTWDDFAQEFDQQMAQHISDAQAELDALQAEVDEEPGNERAFHILNLKSDIDQMQRCKQNLPNEFSKLRSSNLDELKKSLLKRRNSKRALDFTSARSAKNLIRAADRKHPLKRKRKDPKKRRHVKTGLPRGWNMRPYVQAPHRAGRKITVRERRKRRRARRKQFRQEHKANNTVRSLRQLVRPVHGREYWKAYPLRRAPKVTGWLERFLDGKK